MSRAKKRWKATFQISDQPHANGIKIVSYENFLAPEITALKLGPFGLNTDGCYAPNSAFVRYSVDRFTQVRLPDSAPAEAAKIFAVAQGAMTYGLFFYPLFTLGMDHLLRLYEWIVRDQIRKHKPEWADVHDKFLPSIQWLVARNILPKERELSWIAMYHLRNSVSHLTYQHIVMPGDAVSVLRQISELIMLLYPTANEPS